MASNQNTNALAEELNKILDNCVVGRMLSDLGRRIYFPKGIIAQGEEAKRLGKTANATVGTAVEGGAPLMLSSIKKHLPSLSAAESVSYSPTAGNPSLREKWKALIIKKNPSLQSIDFSLPVLVPGLTAGISYLCDMFLDETRPLLAADPFWENYSLIVEARRNSALHKFKMFEGGAFSVRNFKEALVKEAESGSVRLLLNFPQNPSGYTLYKEEAEEICAALTEIASNGADVIVFCDDAYFGLNYEEGLCPESIFARLASAHERILAVKIDGPTKEDYAWGFRTGFVSFASKGMTGEQYDALVRKMMGLIRSSTSCAATESQSIILKAFDDPSTEKEKEEFKNILRERYCLVKKSLEAHKGSFAIEPLPFNSGYFMCLRCIGVGAEQVRQELLAKHGIGTVAIDEQHLRVAFSSLEAEKIEYVYSMIFKTAEELARK